MSLIDPTQKEIIEEQKAYLKGKGLKYLFQYYCEYYLKGTIFALAVIALIVSIIYTAVTKKESVCNVVFINALHTPDPSELGEILGIDFKKNEVVFDNSYIISPEFVDNSSFVNAQKLVAIVSAKDAEIIVGDYDTVYKYASSEFYADLRDIFSEEELTALGDKLVYYEYVDENETPTGETAPLFIEVTDAPKLKENECFMYDHVLLAFVVNTQRPENAMAFYKYINE